MKAHVSSFLLNLDGRVIAANIEPLADEPYNEILAANEFDFNPKEHA